MLCSSCGLVTCPLPDDPMLAEVARAVNASGHWGEIFDARWRWVYRMTAR